MILLFPIDDYERDILREMTDHELTAAAEKDELVLSYPSTDEFLEALDNQEIDPQAYWHKEVNKVYVVTYHVSYKNEEYRVLCHTEYEASLLVKYLVTRSIKTPVTIATYDGSSYTVNEKNDPRLHILDVSELSRRVSAMEADARLHITTPAVFSVTFTYETPLTGKHHYVVECDTDEEAQKIAHDANSVDGIKYVHVYPVKRPTGTNGIRMSAQEYWKMYGNN